MPQFRRPPITSLCMLGALVANPVARVGAEEAAAAPGQSAQERAQTTGYVDPMRQWLDEVKAQRQAWEARRQAAKEAVNARRRLNDPWGAAQQEARESEIERRREAILEQVERDRDAFHSQRPWQNTNPWESSPPPPPPSQPAQVQTPPQPNPATPDGTALNPAQNPNQDTAEPYTYSPSGWDNRWYYRGY